MGFGSRRAVHLENDRLKLALLPGGGHIAAVTLQGSDLSPLWDPPWETIDPEAYARTSHQRFGSDIEAQLLAGIVGHNLCFDLFGVPSPEEAQAGLGAHGEAPSRAWSVASGEGWIKAEVQLPLAGLRFQRRLDAPPGSSEVAIVETATNLLACDRPVGWTQHVTLGPPFLQRGTTLFEASATRSKTFETEFAPGADRFAPAAEFDWPGVPLADGGTGDLRRTVDCPVSGGYTAHLLDPAEEDAFFAAYDPASETLFGYEWKRADFPWLGIWEENCSRTHAPWGGRTLARGLEFGASPFPETRRAAVERGTLFGERTFRWIPGGSSVTVSYRLFLRRVGRDAAARFGAGLGLREVRLLGWA